MSVYYLALVQKDPGSAYGVTFPDLPGCFSAADRQDEILPNAMEALELYADDLADLPNARDLEALKQDQSLTNELAEGAYLIAVPLIRNTQKTERINITLNKGLLRAIDAEAQRRKMTRSGFLAQAAEREIQS
ncbi:MAG: type II toxin-antitoxin system HicB family antitoxin [Pseudomonadota bacterium]